MPAGPEIILTNARVHGADTGVSAVAIANGVITATGPDIEVLKYRGANTEIIDCKDRALIPGIVDDHLHLFAAAAARMAADCRPAATPTVGSVLSALRESRPRRDGWIRGYGYDDSPLGLGRHLTRHDLDAVERERPVRVEHRSGHACVMNGAGLAAAGIGRETPDPPGGTIARDAHGEPTGLLLDMESWLRQRIGTRVDAGEFRSALGDLGDALLRYGITGVTDAGADNGIDRWRAFEELLAEGAIPLRVTMMVGAGQLDELRRAGFGFGDLSADGLLTLGPAKIMLTVSSGNMLPDFDTLCRIIAGAHDVGFPVAIHAVEREAVVASALALMEHPAPIGNDRIEHCGECPPDVAELVAASGARVVTNTGFLHYDGERYRETVESDLLPHLYPAGALDALAVGVSLGSDAPVVEPNPWAAMAAAVERRTAEGHALGGAGLPSVAHALSKHAGSHRIAPGQPADLAVVQPDPLFTKPRLLPEVRSVLTVVAGKVVWRDGV